MGNIRRKSHGPEWFIQRDLKRFLKDRGWHVEQTHGNLYQTGFPDLYCFREDFRERWIDCKSPDKYTFTKAQKIKWPIWDACGIGIWILTAANQAEYDRLFQPPNWRDYWKASWGNVPDIDTLLDELDRLEAEHD